MTSPTIDENPEPGESGYYAWHEAVAKHHNDKAGVGAHHAASRVSVTASGLAVVSSSDVQGALSDLDSGKITAPDAPADGDALVFDGTAWTADSGTYRKAFPVYSPSPHGWAQTNGSPTKGFYNHPNGLALRRAALKPLADGSGEGGAFPIFVPPGSSWAVEVLWVYAGTSAGNVDFTVRVPDPPAQNQGDDLATESVLEVLSASVTDPEQHILQVTTGSAQTATGWLSMFVGVLNSSTLASGEVIDVLSARLVAV